MDVFDPFFQDAARFSCSKETGAACSHGMKARHGSSEFVEKRPRYCLGLGVLKLPKVCSFRLFDNQEWERQIKPELLKLIFDSLRRHRSWKVHVRNRGVSPEDEIEISMVKEFSPQP